MSNKEKNHINQFKCVGIGASAGGLEAIEEFLNRIPPDTGLSFVIIMHLPPSENENIMPEIISKMTGMKVVKIEDKMHIKPNHVYIKPPSTNVTILNNTLLLSKIDNDKGLNKPIDMFLNSLAVDQKYKAIGIIFSGTGTDGTLGISAIKTRDGIVMAQDPESSKFDGMPKSAIVTGMVDYIASPSQLADNLQDIISNNSDINGDSVPDLDKDKEYIFDNILKNLKNVSDIDFNNYKPNTIYRRINKRMETLKIKDLEEYYVYTKTSTDELNILSEEFLIGVTSFFRDPESFQELKTKVIPTIVNNKSTDTEIRVWVIGCSTGEEAYSVAILFKEYMEENNIIIPVKIFATDIDKRVFAIANIGLYTKDKFKDMPEEYLEKYFVEKHNGYQITDKIRKMVIFSLHDIINNPPFLNIDLISCRNLLIYFKTYPQKKILSSIHFSLVNNGFLMLGKSETIGEYLDSYDIIDNKWKIFQCKNKDNRKFMRELFLTSPQMNKFTRKTAIQKPSLLSSQYSLADTATESFNNKLLEIYIPPGVIVSEKYKIVQIFQDVSPYIKFKPGKLSLNIIKLAHTEISGVLASVLKKVFMEKISVELNNIIFEEGGELNTIDIKGGYLHNNINSQDYAIITFHKHPETVKIPAQRPTKEELSAEPEIIDKYIDLNKSLKNRLKLSEETLQSAIDNLEVTNEELQTSNEELISSNEELQSTNEELQSLNEELFTINSEHQIKIEELTILNNDINNLINISDNIGMLLLDKYLNIRRYTKFISRIINIKQSDIKRSISDISLNLNYENFVEDLNEVMDTGKTKEFEKQDKNDNWYIIKISPYLTREDQVDGIVIIIFDITYRKNAEMQIQREKELLKLVLENEETAKVIIDKDGKLAFINKAFEKLISKDASSILNKDYTEITNGFIEKKGKRSKNELIYDRIKKTKESVKNYKLTFKYPSGDEKVFIVDGLPIFDNNGEVEGAVLQFTIE